jgi:hypothetical protein
MRRSYVFVTALVLAACGPETSPTEQELPTSFTVVPVACQGVRLTSQAAVNAFNCPVASTLFIGYEEGPNDPIVDLSPLAVLTEVTGFLNIGYTKHLKSVTGLPNLKTVGGSVQIHRNEALESVAGLDGLTSVGKGVSIIYNPALTHVSGFAALREIGEGLYILGDGALTNVSGFESLTDIGDALGMSANPELTSVDGFSSLARVAHVEFSSDAKLTDVDILSGITSVRGRVSILATPSLQSLAGLSNLTSVGGNLAIWNVDQITNLDMLANLTSVGALLLNDNDALVHLDGLSNLNGGRVGSDQRQLEPDQRGRPVEPHLRGRGAGDHEESPAQRLLLWTLLPPRDGGCGRTGEGPGQRPGVPLTG